MTLEIEIEEGEMGLQAPGESRKWMMVENDPTRP